MSKKPTLIALNTSLKACIICSHIQLKVMIISNEFNREVQMVIYRDEYLDDVFHNIYPDISVLSCGACHKD